MSLVRAMTSRRRAAASDERRAQAVWLAESALDRAAARVGAEEEYRGETWEVASDQLGGRGAGRVVITVTGDEGADARVVKAVAVYPAQSETPARETREIQIDTGGKPTGDGR